MVIAFTARNFRFTYSTQLGVMCQRSNRCAAAYGLGEPHLARKRHPGRLAGLEGVLLGEPPQPMGVITTESSGARDSVRRPIRKASSLLLGTGDVATADKTREVAKAFD
jgi:hypothetical protein